jgi:hypothetical protein
VPPGKLQYVGLFARPRGIVLGEHLLQKVASLFEVLDLAVNLPEQRFQHGPELDIRAALPKHPFDALQREAERLQLLYLVQLQEIFSG